mgnify:CR=1 FL=1
MFYQLLKSDDKKDEEIKKFVTENEDIMFGKRHRLEGDKRKKYKDNEQFKFSIGAMINECFAAIYHDKVKDGPMRGRPAPSKKNNPSLEGIIS